MTSDPETDRLASLLAAQLAERAIEDFMVDLTIQRIPTCKTPWTAIRKIYTEIEAEDLVVNP